MRFIRPFWATVIAGLLVAATSGAAQAAATRPAALENERLVNQTTTGGQSSPRVARNATGDYVAVWEGNGPGDTSGIFARLYDASGNPKSGEFIVNSSTTGTQSQPDVAMDAAGDFVVVWTSNETGNNDVYDRLYGPDGTAKTAGTTATNTYTTGSQSSPVVAMDAQGNYVVIWGGEGTGDTTGIFGQRVASTGAHAGSQFQVNTHTAGGQDTPAVSSDANGNFVVVWVDNTQEGSTNTGIYGQRYTSAGTTNGSEFHVNTTTAGDQDLPSVAMDADGDFIVVWQSDDGVNAPEIMYSQWFSNGVNQTGDLVVNDTSTNEISRNPKVAISAGGIFAITWQAQPAGGSDFDIRAELHAADRSQIGNSPYEIVSQASGKAQDIPAIAIDADGDFVIVWRSYLQDGDDNGVYARRYAGPEDTDLGVALTDSADPVTRSAAMSYTATITNNHGAAPSAGTPNIDAYYSAIGTATGITATVTLPAGASSASGSGTNWSCSGTTTLSCAYSGKLAPGANTTFTVSLNAPSTGGTANASVSVNGSQYDSAQANNSDTESTTVNPPPDVTPDAFTFTDQSGVQPSTQVTSAAVTITGIEQAVAISVTGGSYSVGCTATFTTNAGTISNGQTVCARHTSSASYNTATNTTLTVGGVSDTFTSTTRAADTTPDAFTFTDQGGVQLGTQVTSAAVTITGIEQAVAISVAGGQYSLDCLSGGFTSSPGTISPGQTVCLRHTSSSAFSTATDTTLTAGGVSDTFTSTTRAADTTPDAFSFTDQSGVATSTAVISNTVTVSGIEQAVPVSVTGGTYSIGCNGTFTSSAGTIANGQTVCLQLTSSASAGTMATATLTIGGVAATWNVTTAAAAAPAAGGGGGGAFGGPALLLLGLAGALRRRK